MLALTKSPNVARSAIVLGAAGILLSARMARTQPMPVSAEPPFDCRPLQNEAIAFDGKGKLRAAKEKLQSCLQRNCTTQGMHDLCKETLKMVTSKMPTVIVDIQAAPGCDVTSVRVTIDDEVRSEHYDGAEIDVDPGEHTFTLEFEMPGQKQIRSGSFTIAAGQTRFRLGSDGATRSARDGGAASWSRDGAPTTVTCDTSAVPRAADAGIDIGNAGDDAGRSSFSPDHRTEPDAGHLPSGSVLGPVLLMGVGAALLAGGSVFGMRAIRGVDDAKSDPALCRQPGYQCSLLGTQVKADAEADARMATGFFIGGGVVAAAGLLWLWKPWETVPSPPEVNVSAAPTRGGGIVSASGRF